MYTTLYSAEMVYGRRRLHDDVLYYDGREKTECLIDILFIHMGRKLPSKYRLVLIHKLDLFYPQIGNRAVVDQFVHQRFKYRVCSTGYDSTILVPTSSLLPPVMLLIDPYWLKRTYGIQSKCDHVDDDPDTQANVFFMFF